MLKELSEAIVAAAVEVHRALGPGLLEPIYEECFCRELALRGLRHERQVGVPVRYKGLQVDCAHRLNVVVEGAVVVEVRSIEKLLPVHSAQLSAHLKLAGKRVGFLINFNVPILIYGVVKTVLQAQ